MYDIYIYTHHIDLKWFPKGADGFHLRIHCLDWIDATSPPGDFRDRGVVLGWLVLRKAGHTHTES